MTNWGLVFEDLATQFLSQYGGGCKVKMQLQTFAVILDTVKKNLTDFTYANPIQSTEFMAIQGAVPLVSSSFRYTPGPYHPYGHLVPPGKSVSLSFFGGVLMRLYANATTNLVTNKPYNSTIIARRAYLDSLNINTWEDLVHQIKQHPKKFFTICGVSFTSLGGNKKTN